ncbi:hypothetical protein KJ885_03560 [Patescibacteria group bacterium]|nr:hypothetical protein [Patescibacteria group bacterium]
MERVEFIFKALRHIAWSLVLEGLLLIALGILVYAYPKLVIILASLFFVVVGLTVLFIGFKVRKYSKIKIDF